MKPKLIAYKGHRYISVRGNAQTPARFWGVRLLTQKEYETLSEELKKNYSLLRNYTSARFLIGLHNL